MWQWESEILDREDAMRDGWAFLRSIRASESTVGRVEEEEEQRHLDEKSENSR